MLDGESDAIAAAIAEQAAILDIIEFGQPVHIADSSTERYTLDVTQGDDWGNPFPTRSRSTRRGGDRHLDAGRVPVPATKTNGSNDRGADVTMDEGARVQLDPDIDTPGLGGIEKMVAVALQKYRADNADNGGASMTIGVQTPPGGDLSDPTYGNAGITDDYQSLDNIPWDRLRAQEVGRYRLSRSARRQASRRRVTVGEVTRRSRVT